MLNGRVKVVVGRMMVVVRMKRWMRRGADILGSLQLFHLSRTLRILEKRNLEKKLEVEEPASA